jgi:bifunctional aspartokinase / homoserine dehydrogenase 1
MLLSDTPLDLESWRVTFASSSQPLDMDQLTAHIQPCHVPHSVLVDCTPSHSVAGRHVPWLQAGIHVVSNNTRCAWLLC